MKIALTKINAQITVEYKIMPNKIKKINILI
ncbi:hypothetical protein SRABI04_03099 [Chryseobacterium sp. Bi04]|nr:hypothetical protein SRABI04_03099 [Chryseobacterium sp. Bi04]